MGEDAKRSGMPLVVCKVGSVLLTLAVGGFAAGIILLLGWLPRHGPVLS